MIQIDGDSIARGVGASTPENSWHALATPINTAVDSTQAADDSRIVQEAEPDPKRVYVTAIGGNDAAFYKNDAAKQEYFRRVFRSILAWRLLPDRKTGRGAKAGITFSGTWADTPSPSPCGKFTTAYNASGTATVNGDTVYIALSEGHLDGYDVMSDQVKVVIDSVDKGTFSVDVQGIMTHVGQWYGRACWRFSGLGAGNHTVTITNLSQSGKYLHLDYIAGSTQAAAPRVIVGNCVKFTDAYMTDLGITASTIQAYNTIISDVVAEFTAHGRDVQIMDRYSVINQAIHSSDYWGHPNDAGQIVLHDLFMNTLQRNY